MGKSLMIQEADDERLESLKKRLGLESKIGVVRAGIDLLEKEADRQDKLKRWRRAATLAAKTSREVNEDFRRYSEIKKA